MRIFFIIIPFETPPPSGRVNAFIDISKIKLNSLYKNKKKIKSINQFQYKFRRTDYKQQKKKLRDI